MKSNPDLLVVGDGTGLVSELCRRELLTVSILVPAGYRLVMTTATAHKKTVFSGLLQHNWTN